MYIGEEIFEVQGYADGEWRTLGAYGDCLTAKAQTMRVRRTKKYLGVRVVSERFDSASRKYFSRTIYQYSTLADANISRVMHKPAVRAGSTHAGRSLAGPPAQEMEDEDENEHFAQTLALRLSFVIGAATIVLAALRIS